MRFLLRRVKSLDPQQKANGTAAAVALFAVGFLYLESQPRPAGADTIRMTAARTAPVINLQNQIAEENDANLTPAQLAHRNLSRKIAMLEKGLDFLKSTPDYTAQFTKRELVNGELLDEQTITMKLRHEPFSVYLKWQDYDQGREVMYVDGVNDGNMLVHAGGWKARLPAMLMPPDSSLAMKEARYPVTRAGLQALADSILGYNRKDLEQKTYANCHQLEDQVVGDRLCCCFVLEYLDAATSADYRKSITLIDKEWCVPLYIKNYGWPNADAAPADSDLDEATLIEHYTYSDIKFRSSLTQLDFDHSNEDYGFKKQ